MSLQAYDDLTPPPGQIWELHEGYVVAFSTGTEAHAILCTRIAAALDGAIEAPCRAFGAATIGVRSAARETNLVPDGAVTCEDHVGSRTHILAPKLVVEVISAKSVVRDRITKLDFYRAMPSVHEYLMLDSRRVWASLYRRGPADTWIDRTYVSLSDTVGLVSIELELSLAHLYRGIDLTRKRQRPG